MQINTRTKCEYKKNKNKNINILVVVACGPIATKGRLQEGLSKLKGIINE